MADYEIVGGGQLGTELARLLTSAGYSAILRVPEPADEKYAPLRSMSGVELMKTGPVSADTEAIFLATPWETTLNAVSELGDMNGRLIIDCTNPVTYGPTGMSLVIDANSSASELIAKQTPGATVVKTLNQLGAPVLNGLSKLSPAPVMGIACDQQEVADKIADLLKRMGLDPIHVGGLANARLLESFALLWMSQAFSSKNPSTVAFTRCGLS
ncbi:MAG: NAD(P)-binding domain-containing protein [Pseudomonadota bacterium]